MSARESILTFPRGLGDPITGLAPGMELAVS